MTITGFREGHEEDGGTARTGPVLSWNLPDRTSIPEVILRGERQLYGLGEDKRKKGRRTEARGATEMGRLGAKEGGGARRTEGIEMGVRRTGEAEAKRSEAFSSETWKKR